MKRKIVLMAMAMLATIVALLTSCSTIYTYRESTARFVEPVRVGFITPVTADMQVSQEKISYSDSIPNTLNKKDIRDILIAEKQGKESILLLNWKKNAISSASKKYNADDIISPVFEIKPTDDASYIIVTVTGNPAVYVNYRKATQEDVNLVVPLLEDKKSINAEGSVILYKR